MLQSRNNLDIELAQSNPPVQLGGYPTFAEFVARDPDAAIYRKFERLSACRLLYLQSELHGLEGQLQALDKQDAEDINNNEEAQKAARYWDHYSDQHNSRGAKHRELRAKIAVKIKEYRM
jgi:hypothetical protein